MRQRLLDRLEQRFDVTLTLVVGGGGAGKSTLLAQALTDAVDRFDVWAVAVEADDEERLIGRLLAGLGRHDGETSPAALTEAILARSPRQVCLMVDDAHRLSSTAALTAILGALPRNGHLLLGSRRRPPLDLARLETAGGLLEISQSELLLTDAEVVEFARTRRVDAERLVDAEGWPAFVELASRGSPGHRYLEDEAVGALPADRLVALARFAYVGGGDDEMARAVSGMPLEALTAGLPLMVGDVDTAIQPHDLWLELIGERLDERGRREAAVAAASVLGARGDFDPAVELVARVGAAEEFLLLVRDACIEIMGGGLRPDRVKRWTALIPPGVAEAPAALLLRGLHERDVDITSERCWELFNAAADGFRLGGDHEAEIAALAQCGYLGRMRPETGRIDVIHERFGELVDAGIVEARPFMLLAEAWKAMTLNEVARQLAALEAIVLDDMPQAWRKTVNHLKAVALTALGRPEEALEVVPKSLHLDPMALPGALGTEDQATWYAGHPEVVVARGLAGIGPEYGARDRFVAAIFATLAYGFAGDVDEASRSLAIARDASGSDPSLFMSLQLALVGTLPALAIGEEDPARRVFEEVLERAPLGNRVTENFLGPHAALPYVLVPATRAWWDQATLPAPAAMGRSIGQVLAANREADDLGPARLYAWPPPGKICALIPGSWAVELALIGMRAGAPAARGLAAWACEHWGAPARETLRRFAAGSDSLATEAQRLLGELPTPPDLSVEVAVLGPMELRHGGHRSVHEDWRRERVRALLLHLILHRSVTRERLAEELWPDIDPVRADKNLRTTLSYLHGVLEPMREARDAPFCVRSEHGILSLHHSVQVDLWEFDRLLDEATDAERRGSSSQALELTLQALALWRGNPATGEADHPWADLARTRAQSRLVRAATRAGELLVAMGLADEAIRVCHLAIETDRWFEPAYACLARAYTDLDDLTSARATLRTARQALTEIGLELSASTDRLLR